MPLIQYLSRVQFEFGALGTLSEEITRLGLKRPLLVTDKGVASAGLLDKVLTAAQPHNPIVYDGTTENPNEASLDACMSLWQEHGCDGVIAVGGGSPVDLSKAVALLASHGGAFAEYGVKAGGSEKIGKVAAQIAIPTAAGTGAEVGRACVMTLHNGRKTVAVNLNMVADVVICDPDLTISLPPHLTAGTGVDALSHGIETFCSPTLNPPAEAIARDCIVRAAKWLPIAVEDGRNREARWNMMMAALEGGMVLQKGLGGAHAMANPLGESGYHHGTLIGILLPHVMAFNAPVLDGKWRELKSLLSASADPDQHMSELVSSIGLPSSLSALGVKRNDLLDLSVKAAADHLSATNPREAGDQDYLTLLRSAL